MELKTKFLFRYFFFYFISFRSGPKTFTNYIKTDVEISDFFELINFQCGNDFNIASRFASSIVLFRGELEQELAEILDKGGSPCKLPFSFYFFLNLFFFIRDFRIFKFYYEEKFVQFFFKTQQL